ncbi:hypothetical protein CVT25_009063 [Psilocybe cyanescens]|uniref:Extracellular membrane protein CFEM domain-containing protein n=1 Tax=Psilocybe cyanescens TaxID=93625 RepID=A0A409XDK5_PSICY|nr:hypothetical protein CVT25_009063 [Psilocybe cyanescens]
MVFNIFVTPFALITTLLCPYKGKIIVAYGGTDCTCSVGNSISGGSIHCITLYEQDNCQSSSTTKSMKLNPGTCKRINTAGPV